MRTVPDEIERPPYAADGSRSVRGDDPVKSPDVIERMRRTGVAAAEVLAEVGAAIAPGVTTDELDRLCHEACIARGGYPSPLNYGGFPKSLCTSVNEVICHGIPDDRPLRDGDIVNLDVTLYREGVHGDTNATVVRRHGRRARRGRWSASPPSRWRAASPRSGRAGPLSDIGRAIQTHAEAEGFARRAGLHRPRHRRGVPRRPAGAPLLRPPQLAGHEARHGLHHRADDRHGRPGATGCGTTTGPRSPPTAAAPPSSSTPSSSPTTAPTSSRCDLTASGPATPAPPPSDPPRPAAPPALSRVLGAFRGVMATRNAPRTWVSHPVDVLDPCIERAVTETSPQINVVCSPSSRRRRPT